MSVFKPKQLPSSCGIPGIVSQEATHRQIHVEPQRGPVLCGAKSLRRLHFWQRAKVLKVAVQLFFDVS